MQTEDHLENITEYSDAVQVTVRDYDGSIRVFNLDHAKVVLRYVPNNGTKSFAYHPTNIQESNGYRTDPGLGDYLELVIMTENLIVLDSDK